jgi:hypothetical protein
MKTIKKMFCGVLALTMLFALTACSKSSAVTVADAVQKLNDVKSMSYVMDLQMDMSIMGQTINTSTFASADYIADPLALKLDMDISSGTVSQKALTYAVAEGDKLLLYSSTDGGETWFAQESDGLAALEQYDAKSSFNLYAKSAPSFKEAGAETVDGAETLRFDGVINGDALRDVLASSGMDDQLSGLGLDLNAADLFSGFKDGVPISIWVDQASGLPKKYEMDMTSMMNALMQNLFASLAGSAGEEIPDEALSLTVDKVLVGVTITAYDNVTEIVIPEAALNTPRAQ